MEKHPNPKVIVGSNTVISKAIMKFTIELPQIYWVSDTDPDKKKRDRKACVIAHSSGVNEFIYRYLWVAREQRSVATENAESNMVIAPKTHL